ncbi:MAG: GAF domain-containing sensor histidine kinase, partial [Solirubrobacteraceae bacterium]
FYDSICEALCRLTTMRRAVLFLYDSSLARVVAVGCPGVDPTLLADVHGTLEETPMAQRALAEDSVQEISSEELELQLPARFRGPKRVLDVTTLTCTPMHAGDRSFGVIFADRGGRPFKITDDERHAMWMLGKLAALAASARGATRQQERARRLSERIELTRQVHERVMHRLFGVSLALTSGLELAPADRERCGREISDALADLRSALARMPGSRPHRGASTLRQELERLKRGYADVAVTCHWQTEHQVPEAVDSLAQAVLGEALRNAIRHAAPTMIEVCVHSAADTFSLEVLNDGVGRPSAGTGVGLRLASLEALQLGGVVEFGSKGEGRWRTRLMVPL